MSEDPTELDTSKLAILELGDTSPKDRETNREWERLEAKPAEAMTTHTEPPDPSDLCVSCGLCCNGVLYSNIKAEREEVQRLEAAGHEVDQVGERLQFHPPCHHHQGGRCTIYETRYTKCRSFRCALLQRLDAGELPLTEALGAVAQSKGMVARIAALDPDLALLAHRVALRQGGPPQPGSSDVAAARIWIESIALDMFLDRTFRNNPVLKF